ncbi:hypothetical protein THRCLA_20570 [Thraustotheca clavata]|uniref:Symplekin C-terminal domain-containing protein n=1 Tax=Thraustotheca clavata TaxID=74557 RepID=A0A1W0A5T4_9STRA|nr:hypothetical protein THRCLA_20570 [Thraustotheca clavata]
MDASTHAFKASCKYLDDASLKNFKRDDAKRTMQFKISKTKRFKREVQVEKPVAITTESLVNLPSDQVVDFVLVNMANLPSVAPLNAKGEKIKLLHTPSALKDRIMGILLTLASPSSAMPKRLQCRDPRRQNNVAPSLLHIFDENSLDNVTNIVCANAQTLVEPIISVTKDQVTREYNAIRVNIKPVTDEWCRQMALLTISRMLENEYGTLTSNHEKIREGLVCRLATSRWLLNEKARFDSKSVHKHIVDFVDEQLQKRYMILVLLVYEEYTRSLYDTLVKPSEASHQRYIGLLKLICSMLQARLDPNIANDRKLFYSLLSHIPRLTEDVLRMMVAQLVDATDNQRLVMGVSAIRNYIMDRSTGQEACLNILLHFATHVQDAIRNLTIRCLANQIYPLPKMHGFIEAYAIELMESLYLAQEEMKEQEESKEQEETKEKDDELMGIENYDNTMTQGAEEKPVIQVSSRRQFYLSHIQLATDEDQSLLTYAKNLQKMHDFSEAPESEQQVLQRLELFLALCAKKPTLFSRLVTTYSKASPPVQHVLMNSLDKLIRHLKQREGDLVILAQLQPFPPAALDFVVHIVHFLVSLSREASTLIEPVFQLYQNHQDIPEAIGLLIPIVSKMPTDIFLPLLPFFFTLPHARLTEIMAKLLGAIPLKVDPTSLLLALHHIPEEAEHQKSVLKAIGMCLKYPAVFTVDIFQSVIVTLFQEDPIPKFTLRTMIQAVQLYPKLRKPMATNMKILVIREIWTMDEMLWKGFMKGAVVVQPHSFPILLTLPLSQGQSILEMDEGKDLVKSFKAFCSKESKVPEDWRTVYVMFQGENGLMMIKSDQMQLSIQSVEEYFRLLRHKRIVKHAIRRLQNATNQHKEAIASIINEMLPYMPIVWSKLSILPGKIQELLHQACAILRIGISPIAPAEEDTLRSIFCNQDLECLGWLYVDDLQKMANDIEATGVFDTGSTWFEKLKAHLLSISPTQDDSKFTVIDFINAAKKIERHHISREYDMNLYTTAALAASLYEYAGLLNPTQQLPNGQLKPIVPLAFAQIWDQTYIPKAAQNPFCTFKQKPIAKVASKEALEWRVAELWSDEITVLSQE